MGGSADRGRPAFFGHPRGLGVLAFTEGGISFSYYGMQSLLVLYLTSDLLRPEQLGRVLGFTRFATVLQVLYGPLHGQALASAMIGLFSALIWATPILGGLLADGLLGRTRTIILGGILLSTGHLLMGFVPSFLIAQACLIAGLGCTGSIKAQVGGLYGPRDPRRGDGFQIYTMSAAFAVIIAPLVCGTLGERVAWHWGFAAAAAGMLGGLLVYLLGRGALPREPGAAPRAERTELTASEWRRLAVLLALLPVLAMAMVGNMQIFNAYLLWARQSYDLVVFGRTLPVTWLLSLDALLGVGTTLLSVLFWRWLARRRAAPGEMTKMIAGAALLALAPLILAFACWQAGTQRIGLGWAVAFQTVNGLGFANLYAIGLALYSRASPPRLGATVVNAYALHLFLANLLVGWLAGLLQQMPPAQFWLLHAGLIGLAGALLAAIARLFRQTLASPPPPQSTSA